MIFHSGNSSRAGFSFHSRYGLLRAAVVAVAAYGNVLSLPEEGLCCGYNKKFQRINLTILSRTKPERIDKELFRKFSENDENLARKYAFSAETARKNRVELDYWTQLLFYRYITI